MDLKMVVKKVFWSVELMAGHTVLLLAPNWGLMKVSLEAAE